jgi:hypothetical protein
MNPPSFAFRELQEKVTIHQQKFFPIIMRRVHHVTFASPTASNQSWQPGLLVATRDQISG